MMTEELQTKTKTFVGFRIPAKLRRNVVLYILVTIVTIYNILMMGANALHREQYLAKLKPVIGEQEHKLPSPTTTSPTIPSPSHDVNHNNNNNNNRTTTKTSYLKDHQNNNNYNITTTAGVSDRRRNIEEEEEERYLLYFSHSGLSNQLIGLQNAANFALAINRTLVISPVLPHVTFFFEDSKKNNSLFPHFVPRSAGSKCIPYNNYKYFIPWVKQDVRMARNNPTSTFPSFLELFDFNDIYQKTGLHVIDMKDFANNNNISRWCGEGVHMETKLVPGCEKSEHLSFTEAVEQFQNICGTDQKIAVIGSPYVMPSDVDNRMQQYFQDELMPSHKMMLLMKQIYSHFPSSPHYYTGVAIRFKDSLKVNTSCDTPTIKEGYEEIFRDLVEKIETRRTTRDDHNQHISNHTTTTNSIFVLLSNGHEAALRCFRHHSSARWGEEGVNRNNNTDYNYSFNVTTVTDIVQNDDTAQLLLQNIKSEIETIYAVLDQILVGLADDVVLQMVDFTQSGSTFHQKIRSWHNRREAILERMMQASTNNTVNVTSS